jgi:DNA repair protein RadC
VLGNRHDVASFLATVRAAMLHSLRMEALSGPVLSTAQALIDYLGLDLAHAPVERFRVLFLNAQNRLLDEATFEGTVSEAPVYPREIMRRALELGATALLVAHNHPSGDPTPSECDVRVTGKIADAGRALGVVVHDHVIIARTGWRSLRTMGLLPAPANG